MSIYVQFAKSKLQHFKSQMKLRSADGEARLRSDFWISCETPNPPWLVVEVPVRAGNICTIYVQSKEYFLAASVLGTLTGQTRYQVLLFGCQNIIWAPAVVVVPDATISVPFWRDTMRVRNSRRPSLNINCFFIFIYIASQFDQV